MEREGDIINKVTITRGATIKVPVSETDRCTRGINKTREKSYPEDLKIRTFTER
jgi:hypothetical protein